VGSTLLIDGLNFLPVLDTWMFIVGEATPLTRLLGNVWLGLQVALGLGFVVFVHELGHFLAAKTFGVRCDKFYVGFDVPISIGPIKLPRTLGKFQWGETEYGIGIIPLGGYVKMLGQDDDPRQAEIEAEKIRLGEGTDAPLDPRSYPAKPVWQRMIIISAGVVMNLIFAVILAGIAYWFGVPYNPTVAGSTLGGGPAWAAGIQTGDQVLKFGEMQEEDPYLRYGDFAVGVVMQGFDDKTKPLPITVLRADERVELTATASAKFSKEADILRVGLMTPTVPKVSSPPYSPHSYLAARNPDLKPGDVITAVNGELLKTDERFGVVLGSELTSRLQASFEKPISVTLQRPAESETGSTQEIQLELPPVPVKSIGLGFTVGPVTAIQTGSRAASSNLKVGDVIQAINGEALTDALRLPARVAGLAGKEITLTVLRTVDPANPTATESIDVTLPGPERATFDPISDIGGELTLGGLGVALSVQPKITSVDARFLSSEGAVQIGDELLQVQWVAPPERKQELSQEFSAKAFEPMVIDRLFNVATLYDMMQSLPVGAPIKCWVRRDGKMVDGLVKLEYADGWYWHQRGIAMSPLMHLHQTDSIANALQLGTWETSRRFGDVLTFLRLLVTGKIGAKGVGGPIEIARAAGSEASYGVSRLMIFLTLLSANLAILNFLPIPALDGGHMMFLIAEAIRGKPVNEALQVRLTMLGVLGLLSLMAFVIVKDIMRLVS
jgi:regulator of sigma E protease